MVPGNIYKSLAALKSGSRLPICHSGMLPWTAEFVANVIKEAQTADSDGNVIEYDTARVILEARKNAKDMYNI